MYNLQLLSDHQLQQMLLESNYDAFTELYSRYQTELHRFLFRFLQSSTATEDAAQDVFTKIWENRSKLQNVKVFKAYLFVVARNHALDSLKKGFRSGNTIKEITESFSYQSRSAEDDLVSKEYLNFIEKTLHAIPHRSREIFLLCREQNKSYDEVATDLGISRNAVKNHMVFAMKVLRANTERDLGITLSLLLAAIYKH
ncbi:RNA polymerase sigma factor [Mucilaginibacter phyllosphaerae]|uniref:RNA polymerase sigma-70 factor n=1 Tax=Mucilaginibacter phyllosphaerae TaxID=1812349 RepID=A0A4Y8ABS4_9SPHI|nr:RNA polymerase sigma-70 factor [Mucilaginibacter phyllosphaerae]MBB3969222.1 RNA polymerase sigma-70 factor (ECF subfamily) [Mucilaginibacter phyllosphaerae]TEW65977.1 RNA polymerase sigma-70 factor [Mucilaginibacter phyllosphaerae]GGH07085.1 RNA polymerase sigma-70 factor [Mucilaginibacter phyllosphaerae]